MQFSKDLNLNSNFFADAIEHHVQSVSPELMLTDVVTLMTQGANQIPLAAKPRADTDRSPTRRSSCVLIVQNSKLVGIFTERDVVKLTVEGIDFAVTTVGEVMSSPVITIEEKDLEDDIRAALFLFRRYQIRHLVAIDKSNRAIGTVTPDSIRHVMRPTNLLKLRRVAEVMTTEVIHAQVSVSVMRLAQLMAEHQVSCVVITKTFQANKQSPTKIEPVGIVTERDLVKMRSQRLNLIEIFAGEVMSNPLSLLNPEDSLWAAHEEMQRRKVQRLVVSWDSGTKIGILTQTNLLRVFDSVEHNAVIEAVRQALTELKLTPVADTPQTSASNLQDLLARIQGNLQYLVDIKDLTREHQQFYLQLAIADVRKIGNLLDISV
jgi:CBS domain-containing protein